MLHYYFALLHLFLTLNALVWRCCAPSTISYGASTLFLGEFTQVHPITVSTDSSGLKVILTGKPWGPISPGAPAFPMPPCGRTPQWKKTATWTIPNSNTASRSRPASSGSLILDRCINWSGDTGTLPLFLACQGYPRGHPRLVSPGATHPHSRGRRYWLLFWGLRMDLSLN